MAYLIHFPAIVKNVWQCPCCGKHVLTGDDLEYGDLLCDACETLLEYAGHCDIETEES